MIVGRTFSARIEAHAHIPLNMQRAVSAALVRARHAAELPVFLMGHSLGSLIALCAAGRIPKLRALAISGCAVVPGYGSASPFGCACLYPVTQTGCGVCLTGVCNLARRCMGLSMIFCLLCAN